MTITELQRISERQILLVCDIGSRLVHRDSRAELVPSTVLTPSIVPIVTHEQDEDSPVHH